MNHMQDSNFYDGNSLEQISRKQHLFLRYFTAFLIDLVILNILPNTGNMFPFTLLPCLYLLLCYYNYCFS